MTESINGIPDEWRKHCNDEALKCWGTAYMFEKRAKSLRWKNNFLIFLSIALPASIGVMVSASLCEASFFDSVLKVTSGLGLLLLVLTILSVVYQWSDKLSYYLESKSSNYRLANLYGELARSTSLSDNDFDTRMEVLDTENDLRTDLDNRHDISDKEKRIIMHAGLFKYQRQCITCKQIPKGLKQTKGCMTCGK